MYTSSAPAIIGSRMSYCCAENEVKESIKTVLPAKKPLPFNSAAALERIPSGSSHFAAMAEDFSKDGVVIVVSRSFVYCGFSGARAVGRNVYLVHTSYYFSLAKRFGLAEPARVIKIT